MYVPALKWRQLNNIADLDYLMLDAAVSDLRMRIALESCLSHDLSKEMVALH